MKTCSKCGVEKPVGEFYKHPTSADGYLGKCKECAKADSRAGRKRRIEHYRQYDRARSMRTDRVEARKSYASTSRGRSRRQKSVLKYRSSFPARRAAVNAVNNAVRDGRLIKKPCERCGSEKVQGHHEDYSKPLEVVWLCVKHHRARHREIAGRVALSLTVGSLPGADCYRVLEAH